LKRFNYVFQNLLKICLKYHDYSLIVSLYLVMVFGLYVFISNAIEKSYFLLNPSAVKEGGSAALRGRQCRPKRFRLNCLGLDLSGPLLLSFSGRARDLSFPSSLRRNPPLGLSLSLTQGSREPLPFSHLSDVRKKEKGRRPPWSSPVVHWVCCSLSKEGHSSLIPSIQGRKAR
jgi:hypothetical protein